MRKLLLAILMFQFSNSQCQDYYGIKEQEPVIREFVNGIFSSSIVSIEFFNKTFGSNNELEGNIAYMELEKLDLAKEDILIIIDYLNATPQLHASYGFNFIRKKMNPTLNNDVKISAVKLLETKIDLNYYEVTIFVNRVDKFVFYINMNLSTIEGNYIADIKDANNNSLIYSK